MQLTASRWEYRHRPPSGHRGGTLSSRLQGPRRRRERLGEFVEHALLTFADADGVEAEESALLGRVSGLLRSVLEPSPEGLGVLRTRLGGDDCVDRRELFEDLLAGQRTLGPEVA